MNRRQLLSALLSSWCAGTAGAAAAEQLLQRRSRGAAAFPGGADGSSSEPLVRELRQLKLTCAWVRQGLEHRDGSSGFRPEPASEAGQDVWRHLTDLRALTQLALDRAQSGLCCASLCQSCVDSIGRLQDDLRNSGPLTWQSQSAAPHIMLSILERRRSRLSVALSAVLQPAGLRHS